MLDLFSGIGGFSLGLERAGMQTVAFCEIDPWARKVLRKHWPDVPIYEDVTKLRSEDVGSVDLVCGGVPCQPFSTASAGKQGGTGDDRFLWPHMLRLAQGCGAPWVLLENVVGFYSLALDAVVSDLEASGYEVSVLEIPACAVGHDHRRSRVWVLGYADSHGKPSLPLDAEVAELPGRGCDAGSVGEEDGVPTKMDRLRGLGNAVVPAIPELIGRAILAVEAEHLSIAQNLA